MNVLSVMVPKDSKSEHGCYWRSIASHIRSRRSNTCHWQRSRRLPRVCLLPLHAALLAALLLAGLLPLYYNNVRLGSLADTYTILCGLYPNSVGTPSNLTGPLAPLAPMPPLPPGARDVSDHDACKQDFKGLLDYEDISGTFPWGDAAFILFGIVIEDVSPKRLLATARIMAMPGVPFQGPLLTIRLPPGIVLSLSFNGADPLEYVDGDGFLTGTPWKADNIPMDSRPGLSHYPFDQYKFNTFMWMKFINTSDGNSTAYVPFVVVMATRNPDFSFTTPIKNSGVLVTPEISGFLFRVVVSRTAFTRAFSMFIFVAMWALTLFCVVTALKDYFSSARTLGFDSPTYSATLLFALPAVRQVQPGVPDVGAIIDIVGFFWNMVLLVLVCSLLLAKIYGNRTTGDVQSQVAEAAGSSVSRDREARISQELDGV